MSRPVRAVEVAAGETWADSFFWCESPFTYKTITAVERGWPTYITVAAHGIPSDTRVPVFIQGAKGAASLNVNTTPHVAERFTDDVLVLLDVNTLSDPSYKTGSGVAKYMLPKDLSAFIPRGQIRRTVDGAVLVDITSDEVELSVNGLVTINLSETQTRAMSSGATEAVQCILHLELVDGAIVERPVDYEFTVHPEGTQEP